MRPSRVEEACRLQQQCEPALPRQHGPANVLFFADLSRQTESFHRDAREGPFGVSKDALKTLPTPPLFWNAGESLSAQRAIYLTHSGRTAEATELINRFLSERDFADPEDGSAAILLRYLLEASRTAGDVDAAAVLESRLARLSELLLTGPAEITNCMGRELGDAAVLLGEPEKARDYYERGIAVCEKGRHRPELALTRAHLPELLLDHNPDEHDAAIERLDFAIAEFREMKMQPALERGARAARAAEGVGS
jgi:tetratricopeptide (TPR) repeat protein